MNTFKKLASVLLIAGCLSSPAIAQDPPQLSDKTFRTVNKVQKWIAEEKYAYAIEKLESAIESTKKKKYDRAVLLQQMGFLYSLREDYKQAANYFAQALEVNALPCLSRSKSATVWLSSISPRSSTKSRSIP